MGRMVMGTEKLAAVWFVVVLAALAAAVAAIDGDSDELAWHEHRPPRPGRSAVIHRAAQAVESLMELHDASAGRWQFAEPWYAPDNAPWWQSGNALQALLDFVDRSSGNDEYLLEAARSTVRLQREPLPWWPQGDGEFRASSTDDTGWWALALCRLFDLTNNATYLEVAARGEAYMRGYWDDDDDDNSDNCGGGIWWDVDPLRYKTAISNALLLKLQASLHNRLMPTSSNNNETTYYLDRALETWNWFNESGLISEFNNLVNDRLTDDGTCENNRDAQWTYNQGVAVGALAELSRATGNDNDNQFLDAARAIADAVAASPDLSPNGILTEPCELAAGATGLLPPCNADQASFKGILARNLAELDDLLPDDGDGGRRPYRSYLRAQAFSLYVNGRNGTDYYGLDWEGPFDSNSTFSLSTQVSAVSLLAAVIDRDDGGNSNNNNSSSGGSTITLSPPVRRFTPWLLLDDTARGAAATILGYSEDLWNFPGTADIETRAWNALTLAQQTAASEDFGLDHDTWNCYQNHYAALDWTELAAHQVQEYWAVLGWTAASWDGGDNDNSNNPAQQPASFSKTWDALTPLERAAARDLCFFNYTWAGGGGAGGAVVPLTDWPAWPDTLNNATDHTVTAMPSASPVTNQNGTAVATNSSTLAPDTTTLMPAASPSRMPETAGPPTAEPSLTADSSPATVQPSMNASETLRPSAAPSDGSMESTTVLPTVSPPSSLTASRASAARWRPSPTSTAYQVVAVLVAGLVLWI